jgi:nucleoside-diphosphate-sugar epimerase
MEANSTEAFLLYTSSISIYGDRVKNPVIQVSDPLPEKEHDPYTITKVEAEKYIRNSAIDWSIFRLTAIMGVGNHKMTGLMFDMPLETPLEIATVRDTARAIVHAIDKTHLLRQQIFNLGGGEKCRISYLKFLTKAFEAFGLGKVNFPDYAFAKQNFHCGYYGDGDDLEEILHFRQDDIESYFERFSASVPFIQRIFTMPFAAIVKYVLLRFSKPFKAYKKRDVERIKFYFGGNDI